MSSHASAGAVTLYSLCEEGGLVFLIKGSRMKQSGVAQSLNSWISGFLDSRFPDLHVSAIHNVDPSVMLSP